MGNLPMEYTIGLSMQGGKEWGYDNLNIIL